MKQLTITTFLIIGLYHSFTSKTYAQFAPPIEIDQNTGLITNILTADINNDNQHDLIVTRKFSTNNLVSYYLNQGDFVFDTEVVIATGNSQVTNIAVGDFNNDNWLDIVSIGDANNAVTLYLNNQLTFSTQILDTFEFFESDISVADINNDNALDIVAVGGTTFKVFYNDGLASFTSQAITTPIEDFFDIDIHDIDNDGFEDVITGGTNISVYKNNNGTLSYDTALSNQIPSTFNLFVRLEDLDGDGDVDLFSEDNNSSGVRWMQNDGDGNFSNLQIIDATANNVRQGVLRDFDGDNDIDIIISKDFNLYLYTNDGSGNFSTPILIQDAETVINVVESGDMNNDGLDDIIWSANLSVQENISTLANDKFYKENTLLTVYPNPAKSMITLQTKTTLNNATLSIYNLLGQSIKTMHSLSGNKISVPINNISNGTYLLELVTENQVFTEKIIIKN